MNGKTHLISEEACPSPHSHSSSSQPSPPSDSSSGGTRATPFVFDGEIMSMDNIHPRIVQDMKAFDGFDMSSFNHQTTIDEFLFDFPPEPTAFPQVMPDIQYQDASIYGGDLFNPLPTGGTQQMILPPTTTGFSPGPAVLDATWQSFVEQLGF
jgi:hypothetical protein